MLRNLLRIIDGVDTEGVDAQFDEPVQKDMFSKVVKLRLYSSLLGNVSFAGCDVGKRIDGV
jgi:hypothetical protein